MGKLVSVLISIILILTLSPNSAQASTAKSPSVSCVVNSGTTATGWPNHTTAIQFIWDDGSSAFAISYPFSTLYGVKTVYQPGNPPGALGVRALYLNKSGDVLLIGIRVACG